MNRPGFTTFVFVPAMGAIFAFRSMRRLQLGVRAPGTVTDYSSVREMTDSGGERTQHYPMVCFRDAAGTEHTLTMSVSQRSVAENKRKAVKVIYPKDKPAAALIANFGSLWLLPLVFFVPALMLAVLVGVHKLS